MPVEVPPGAVETRVRSFRETSPRADRIAEERPLELRLGPRPLAVTLRTPGNDVELGLGFLLAEGVIEERADVADWLFEAADERGDRLTVELEPRALDRWARRKVEREFRSTSACGACGKPDLDSLWIEPVRAGDIHSHTHAFDPQALPLGDWIAAARARQELFEATGGVHAAASFTPAGRCRAVFEDVGRHNALDKLVGHHLLDETHADLLDGHIVLSTGRAGFEIVQKSLRARAAGLLCLGAATSLAVDLARSGGLPLVCFAGSERPMVLAERGGGELTDRD